MAEIKIPATAIFYWDYDGEFGGERSWRNPRKGVGFLEYEGTARILDVLDDFQIKSVFAFVGCAATPGDLPYHAPKQIAEVQRRGHEVACHGWQHEWLAAFSYKQLINILRWSKEALEAASGDQVISFVPPWNVPYRFIQRNSLAIGQFRRSIRNPINIPTLCKALWEVGFKTCRIIYEPFQWAILRWITGRNLTYSPRHPEWIQSVFCLNTNTPGGFLDNSKLVLERTVKEGGLCCFWAHPHSFMSDQSQGEKPLRYLLGIVNEHRSAKQLRVLTPKELLYEVME